MTGTQAPFHPPANRQADDRSLIAEEARRLMWPQSIGHWAKHTPDALYLNVIGDRALNYAETHREGLRWASALERLGIQRGSHVAVLLPNSADFLVLWLGLGWLKSVEVPINTAYRGRMLSYVLSQSDATTLVTTRAFLPALLEVADQLDGLQTILLLDDPQPTGPLPWKVIERGSFLEGAEPVEREGPEPWDIASIVYTSGTTGASKGVLLPWGSLNANGRAHFDKQCGLTSDDGHYVVLPLFHVGGKQPSVAMALLGGRVILRQVFSVSAFWDDIRKHRATIATFLGVITQFIWSQPPKSDDADNPVRVGFGQVGPFVEAFCARFGLKMYNAFGMTEAPIPLTTTHDGVDSTNFESCGQARPGFECKVVDPHDREVPVNDVGELIVRAEPWIMNQGYYKMPDASFAAWRNGWFHTGDAFRRDARGDFYFVGRMKDAIRRRGENISSEEVEIEVLQHPDVRLCAAYAVPAPVGEGTEDEVMIAVIAREGHTIDPAELVSWLIPRMTYFMVPRYVEIMTEFPRTQTEKVRKNELRDKGVTASTWDREAAGIVVKRTH